MTNSPIEKSKAGSTWVAILLLIAVLGVVALVVLQVMEIGVYEGLWPA